MKPASNRGPSEASDAAVWMVRAARGGTRAEDFWDKGCVAFGFWDVPDVSRARSREEIERVVRAALPDRREAQLPSVISQYAKFVLELNPGDWIVTYDGGKRTYYVGRIVGKCEFDPNLFDPNLVNGLDHVRRVEWLHKVERDRLSPAARNTLGSLLSLFRLDADTARELVTAPSGAMPVSPAPSPESETPLNVEELRRDTEEKARGFITDRIIALDWAEMQGLLAGVLRAMGLKTRVSEPGSDRGCDILASPDGLGLSQPRIIVEVKHRPRDAMGSQAIRSFLGGRRPGDHGLYLSTGGFTKDARYEADRANIPLTLLDLEDLVDLLVQHYSKLDAETRALVPLVAVYWPAG